MTPFKNIGLVFTIAALAACGRGGDNAGPAVPLPEGSKSAAASLSFSAIAPAAAGGPEVACAIDKINGQPAADGVINVGAGGDIRFTGWISDPAKQVPGKFTIVLTGPATYGVTAMAGMDRPDVARALDSPALAKSGFNVPVSLGPVAVGNYAVHIIEDANGKVARCTTNTRIAVIKPAG